MEIKKTIAGATGATALIMGGVDASVLNETPIERVETIATERVEAKQIDNRVETTFSWKDQQPIKVTYDMGEPTMAERVADKRKKEVITETVDFGDGGFKIDVILNEKPDTNRFCYDIENAEDYDFFYQPPLTKEEIEDGAVRPPEIEGSYAVYHKTKKNHVLGEENYATGKVMHIPRPEVWEVNNQASTTEWADLSYTEQEGLCVTARQEFLDNATYPVRIDPTFGYTSVGASDIGIGSNRIHGTVFTAPSDVGAISKLTVYTDAPFGGNIKGVIVLNSALTIVEDGVGNAVAGPSPSDWVDSTFSTEPTLSPSTDYLLSITKTGSTIDMFYDTVEGATSLDDNTNDYDNPTDPTDASPYGIDRQLSIYATYTATEIETPTQSEFWF